MALACHLRGLLSRGLGPRVSCWVDRRQVLNCCDGLEPEQG